VGSIYTYHHMDVGALRVKNLGKFMLRCHTVIVVFVKICFSDVVSRWEPLQLVNSLPNWYKIFQSRFCCYILEIICSLFRFVIQYFSFRKCFALCSCSTILFTGKVLHTGMFFFCGVKSKDKIGNYFCL
jgi:hypothetical protein